MGRQIFKRQIDFNLGLGVARQYRLAAAVYLPQDPPNLEMDFEVFAPEISYAAASLIFACELYLRSAAEDRNEAPGHHSLWRHFKRISAPNRKLLVQSFDQRILQRKYPVSLHVVISSKLYPNEHQIKQLATTDPNEVKGDFFSLERILKDTGETYNLWRYLYQSINSQKQHRVLRLHYVHLFCLCEVLDELLSDAYGIERDQGGH
jgi:hypothetical protein